jgi:Tfp pilus assembly protein PilN
MGELIMSLLVNKEHDIETGQIVEIPLTDQEIAEVQKMQEAQNKINAEQKAIAAKEQLSKNAAQAKLEALGLTADDLKALGL